MQRFRIWKESKNPVTNLIFKKLADYKHDPNINVEEDYDVNCGYCEDLAGFITEVVPEAEMVWVDDEFPELDISHVLIKYKNRYYDSEAPYGVSSILELPIVKNLNRVNFHQKHKERRKKFN